MLPIFTTGQIKDGTGYGDLMLDLSDYMMKKDGATKTDLDALTAVVANKLDASPQHAHEIGDVKQLQNVLAGKYDKSEKYSYNVILNDTEKIPYFENPKIKLIEIVTDRYSDGYTFYVDEKSGDLMIVLNDSLIGTYSKAGGKWIINHSHDNYAAINHSHENYATIEHSHDNYATTNHSHTSISNNLIIDGNLTVSGTIIADNLSSNQDASVINELRATDETFADALENHTEALNAVCNATLRNTTKISSVEEIINEYIAKTDAVLKNHYDALLVLCQKHKMVGDELPDSI